jgi:hypothetical protein
MPLSGLKIAGLVADSLTLSGSILLAFDPLFKFWTVTRHRASIDTAAKFEKAGLTVVQDDDTPLSDRSVEDKETTVSSVLAWVGVIFLMTGFAILLVIRIVVP